MNCGRGKRSSLALPEVRTFSAQHTLVNQYKFMSSRKENSTSSDNNRNKLSAYPPHLTKKDFLRTTSSLPTKNFLIKKNLDESMISKLPNAILIFTHPPSPKKDTYNQVSNFFFPTSIFPLVYFRKNDRETMMEWSYMSTLVSL